MTIVLSNYPFLPQLPGTPFPTSISPNLAGLLASLDLGKEECPLVVESPSHSSQVVVGGMIPTIMVSSSTVETILSASPRSTPRVSTSSANVMGGDVHRVIQQHPLSSPNKALIGAGVGRGQVLARKLAKVGIGKGWSIPTSKAMRPEQHGEHVDASTSANTPLPITMRLDHQGPPASYSKVASRPPQSETITQGTLQMCDVWEKTAAHKKEKAAAQATLDHIKWQEQDKQAAWRRRRNKSPEKFTSMRPSEGWQRGGAQQQEEYNWEQRASGACPDPIADPLRWCEYVWAKKDKCKGPKWAEDLWSTSPMDHQQLAMCMVCSWGLVKAYQQTQQNVYICPPAPHILEAYNHKVNHDTHKELNLQEHAVLQYACTLQYVSYCNDVQGQMGTHS